MLIGSNFKQPAEKTAAIYIHYYLHCPLVLLLFLRWIFISNYACFIVH